MNSKEIFSLALGLQHPWYIKEVRFEESQEDTSKILRIDIGFEKGHKFADPQGTDARCPVHDTIERRWRHLNFFEHTCYLHCKVPRVRRADGKVKQVEVPWARKGSGFTMLFEAYSMLLIESEMPVNRVGKTTGEYPSRIWNIFDYWIQRAYQNADHSQVEQLGIDETSTRKGHTYLTLAVDMESRRVLHATPGKGADTITTIREYLQAKGSEPDQIQAVCMDLSPAFISGVQTEFAAAAITFDRFHVKALLNKAMDQLRKNERRQHEALKGHKYTLLKAEGSLTGQQALERHLLLESYPTLGQAYRLKVLFDDFWLIKDPQQAEGFLAYWCDVVEEAGIGPFMKFVKTLQSHWQGVLNYITSRLTNGILEGINSKIQLIKRRARGYRKTSNFINMIYFTCGQLEFDYPQYST